MKKQRKTNIGASLALAGAFAIGGNVYAQEPVAPVVVVVEPKKEAKTDIALRNIVDNFNGTYLFTQQAQVDTAFNDERCSKARLLFEHNSNDRDTIGADFKNNDFRFNVGYIDNPLAGTETTRTTLASYFNKGCDFIGFGSEKFNDLETRLSVLGGVTLGQFNIQATADNTDNFRLVGRYDGEQNHIAASIGRASDKDTVGSVLYNNNLIWVYARATPKLDLSVGFGDVDAGRAALFTSVTDSGDNELIGDTSLAFDAGGFDLFKLYKTPLGKNTGDIAGLLQFREDLEDRLTGTLAYRLGDLGPLSGTAIAADVYHRFDSSDKDNLGASVGIGGFVGDHLILRTRVAYDPENREYFGLMGEIRF